MKYALNLSSDSRILSATLEQYASAEQPIVDELPDGNIADYLYVDGTYVYDPLPEPEPVEPVPSDSERIDALEAKLASYEAAYVEGVNEA